MSEILSFFQLCESIMQGAFTGLVSMSQIIKGFTILFFCSTLSSFFVSTSAGDTLAANDTIRYGDTIVSVSGDFELGFFSRGNSNNRYLGIWYKKRASGTIVWVANRDIPLTDTSGILKLSSEGVLILLDGTNSTIWSSSSSISSKNPVAQLLDKGNFVIRHENDLDPQNFFWQSFDFPDNTMLPGMKIGRDFVSGHNWSLSSWKDNDNPSPGSYKVEFDTSGYPQIFLRNDSAIFFRLGSWNGIRFAGDLTLGPNEIYTYEFVFNVTEISYKYELINSSVLTRIILQPNGRVERFNWIDQGNIWKLDVDLQVDLCGSYARCSAYASCNINKYPSCACLNGFLPKIADDWERADFSQGCIRKTQGTQLNCSDSDAFETYRDKKLPDTQNSWYNLTMNLKECRKMCLENCSCTAYTNTNISGKGSGCLLWFDELIDIRDQYESAQVLYIRMAPGGASSRSRAKKIALIISLSILLILMVLLSCYLRRICNNRKHNEGEMRLNVEHIGTNEAGKEDLPLYDFRTIANATSNFSINCKLGEGGFGPVYKVIIKYADPPKVFSALRRTVDISSFLDKYEANNDDSQGILEDGQEIAVKRLSTSSRQGVEEFRNEVSCIGKLQHRNLVRLLGWSAEEEERMLIYEYMPNKSLDYFVFGDIKKRRSLDWPKRNNIINGIGRGLMYLHQDSRLRVIHRDLKASNILLDHDMNPRISDFGMARSFGDSETEANTTRVVGTYGYMPPEYAMEGSFSVKSDVYSFGVLVIELVSGNRNRFFTHPDHNHNLLGHTWKSYQEDRLLELIDGAILESTDKYEVFRVILIALLCVQQYPEDRPDMSIVLMMLSSKGSLPHPKQPGFFSERKLDKTNLSRSKTEADSFSGHPDSSSSNQTVTIVSPR